MVKNEGKKRKREAQIFEYLKGKRNIFGKMKSIFHYLKKIFCVTLSLVFTKVIMYQTFDKYLNKFNQKFILD